MPLALTLVMAVLSLPATVAFASSTSSPVALGTVRVAGNVTVNDLPAVSGETILSRPATAGHVPSRVLTYLVT